MKQCQQKEGSNEKRGEGGVEEAGFIPIQAVWDSDATNSPASLRSSIQSSPEGTIELNLDHNIFILKY